ncbi:MAG: glycerophosphodiester phosphodiesterase [Clostridia bacterium]|nr:glycerophosphodiester phosphodiesterase [Clostridia bacterium]
MNIFDSWICNLPIAHRGLHDDEVPENSVKAFEKAIEKNYAIELDVRALADGTLVVFHDDTLGRLTGKDGYINNFTYDDVKDLTLLKSNEHIPTFKDVLKLIDGKVPILVEIKNAGKVSFEKDVWKFLSKYKGEYAVQSFNPYSLEWFKINAPHVKRGQLASFFKGNKDISFTKRYVLKRMLLNKKVSEPHFISYQAENLPNKYVKKYSDLPLLAWVVKNQESYDKLKKCCDNIIFEGFDPEV